MKVVVVDQFDDILLPILNSMRSVRVSSGTSIDGSAEGTVGTTVSSSLADFKFIEVSDLHDLLEQSILDVDFNISKLFISDTIYDLNADLIKSMDVDDSSLCLISLGGSSSNITTAATAFFAVTDVELIGISPSVVIKAKFPKGFLYMKSKFKDEGCLEDLSYAIAILKYLGVDPLKIKGCVEKFSV